MDDKILKSRLFDIEQTRPTNYIYVSKGGSDDGFGTYSDPFLTVSKALSIATSGTNIFIYPGTYLEDLTFKAGVNLTSPATLSVYITGNHTANFAGTVIIENIVLNSSTGNTLLFSGNGNKNLQFHSSSVNSTSGHAINWTNTNSSSKINFAECTVNVSTSGSSAKAIYSTTGATGGIIANGTTFRIDNPDNVCLEIGGAVNFNHTADIITGQVVINGSAVATIGNLTMNTSTVPCLVTNSSGTVTLLNIIATTTSTYAFDGTAGSVLAFMAIIYGSTGKGATNITTIPLAMAPIRLRSASLNSVITDGTWEYDGTDLYFCKGSSRFKITMTAV